MREIKFRIYDKKYKKFEYDFSNNCCSWDTLKYDYKNTLGQYIGFKDKNGKEIYEGDICKSNKLGGIGEIHWDEAFTGFVWDRDGRGDYTHFINSIERADDYFDLEVIGNIYENPKLLNRL